MDVTKRAFTATATASTRGKQGLYSGTRARPQRPCEPSGERDVRTFRSLSTMPLHERFWQRVRKTDGCWEWTGLVRRTGYARIRVNGREKLVHRASWELHVGPIPQGMLVCHRCDNPACVRPSHLFLGTQADNSADRDAKGRQARGERQGSARLTAQDVRYIRASQLGQRPLARMFGVDKSTIAAIHHGETWRHVA